MLCEIGYAIHESCKGVLYHSPNTPATCHLITWQGNQALHPYSTWKWKYAKKTHYIFPNRSSFQTSGVEKPRVGILGPEMVLESLKIGRVFGTCSRHRQPWGASRYHTHVLCFLFCFLFFWKTHKFNPFTLYCKHSLSSRRSNWHWPSKGTQPPIKQLIRPQTARS